MTRAWTLPTLLWLCGAACATGLAAHGSYGAAAIFAVAFSLAGLVNSPLIFPRPISAAQAQERSAADGRPIVYWRPGCAFCLRLRLRLGRHAYRAHWVDIWRDPAAAAVVRAANQGNETVPTVVLAGTAHTNPDPAWLRRRLTRSA